MLMPSKCRLVVNGQPIQAYVGETLVDAAIGGWTVIPHDCCSGQCETCRVNVVSGMIDDQGTRDGSTVLACTATLEGDAEIEFDEIPRTSRQSGILSDITPLAPDVVQLTVTLNDAIDYRPGQYFNVKFLGFPARDLSQTFRADGSCAPEELAFQLRRYPGGLCRRRSAQRSALAHRASTFAGRSGRHFCARERDRSFWYWEGPMCADVVDCGRCAAPTALPGSDRHRRSARPGVALHARFPAMACRAGCGRSNRRVRNGRDGSCPIRIADPLPAPARAGGHGLFRRSRTSGRTCPGKVT